MHVVSMLLGLLRLWPSQALRLCTGGLPDSQLAGLKGYFPRLRERLPPERRYIVPEVVDDSVYFETNYEPRYATSLGCCNGGDIIVLPMPLCCRWAETFSWPEEEAKRSTSKL